MKPWKKPASILAALVLSTGPGAAARPTAAPIPEAVVVEELDRAARYLEAQIEPNGRFVYRRNLERGTQSSADYNVLRHAGAVYALATYRSRHPDAAATARLVRAASYYVVKFISPVPGQDGLLAAWSHPELTSTRRSRNRRPLSAKLGGAGIGLTSLLALERVAPRASARTTQQGLASFLAWMQRDDGSFVSRYIPETGGKDTSWESIYYPGEAALGLTMLYERDHDVRWLQAAADALGYLARRRAGATSVEADHWALLATAELLPHLGECSPRVRRDDLIAHVRQICRSILADQVTDSAVPALDGGFTADGRTTPTATRLEGLLAALTVLPSEDADLRARIESAIHAGMRLLVRASINSGPYAGAMPMAVTKLAGEDDAWNERTSEVRIDYVQHAMSAMMQYLDRFHGGAELMDTTVQ